MRGDRLAIGDPGGLGGAVGTHQAEASFRMIRLLGVFQVFIDEQSPGPTLLGCLGDATDKRGLAVCIVVGIGGGEPGFQDGDRLSSQLGKALDLC